MTAADAAEQLRCVCGWRGTRAQCSRNPRQGYITCPRCDARGYDRIPGTEADWKRRQEIIDGTE